jgi:hypothetical protein
VQHIEQIAGAESERDAGGVFLDELQSVEADDFAAHVNKRAAAVAGIDGSIGLNPGSRACFAKFSDRMTAAANGSPQGNDLSGSPETSCSRGS